MIRPLIEDDAEELTALLIANRDGFAAVMPDRPEAYYTVEFQRGRIGEYERRAAEGDGWLFAIGEAGRLAGTIAPQRRDRRPPPGRELGYWVDAARHGRGLATRRSRRSLSSRSPTQACTGSRPARCLTTSPHSACSRRTASSATGSRTACC